MTDFEIARAVCEATGRWSCTTAPIYDCRSGKAVQTGFVAFFESSEDGVTASFAIGGAYAEGPDFPFTRLLANLATLPYGPFGGRDWDWDGVCNDPGCTRRTPHSAASRAKLPIPGPRRPLPALLASQARAYLPLPSLVARKGLFRARAWP